MYIYINSCTYSCIFCGYECEYSMRDIIQICYIRFKIWNLIKALNKCPMKLPSIDIYFIKFCCFQTLYQTVSCIQPISRGRLQRCFYMILLEKKSLIPSHLTMFMHPLKSTYSHFSQVSIIHRCKSYYD